MVAAVNQTATDFDNEYIRQDIDPRQADVDYDAHHYGRRDPCVPGLWAVRATQLPPSDESRPLRLVRDDQRGAGSRAGDFRPGSDQGSELLGRPTAPHGSGLRLQQDRPVVDQIHPRQRYIATGGAPTA